MPDRSFTEFASKLKDRCSSVAQLGAYMNGLINGEIIYEHLFERKTENSTA